MGYERYPRGDDNSRRDTQDYGRDFGAGRDYSYSSARDYDAAGAFDRERGRDQDRYGQRDYGHDGYARYENARGGGHGRGHDDNYRGSYASDGRRFGNVGRYRDRDHDGDRHRVGRDEPRGGYGAHRDRGHDRGGYRGVPQGYDYEDRGFFARAGDEVKSWFGDEEAERRREADMRYDERHYDQRWSNDRDSDYGNWRRTQIAALDRDYDEYRREHRSKFENEFSTWRSNRQTQRDSLGKVEEHMDVLGSDGAHVGTVDKVRGDRILLARNDAEADGRHHSIPSSWIAAVDDKVTLTRTAEETRRQWRDEEQNQAFFGTDGSGRNDDASHDPQGRMLNRSFSGTY